MEENTTGSDDYYWSGRERSKGGEESLQYEATLSVAKEEGQTFNWFFSGFGEFGEPNNSSQVLSKWHSGEDARGVSNTIPYRMNGDLLKPTAVEYVAVRVTQNGITSDRKVVTVERNLQPISTYEIDRECYDYKINLINTTQFRNSTPSSISYTWHFGNGEKSIAIDDDNPGNPFDENQISPHPNSYSYEYLKPGVYYPVLQATYQYNDGKCPVQNVFTPIDERRKVDARPIATTQKSEPVNTYSLANVLAASASTFSDSWLLDLNDLNQEPDSENLPSYLRNTNPFLNGQRGVWRTDASFAYMDFRSYNPDEVKISENGTFTLNGFNWSEGSGGDKWVKAGSMTQYNSSGDELENKDALGRYSTALYGYNNELSTAVGANMKHNELAFTSFEEIHIVDKLIEGKIEKVEVFNQENSGNFNILNSSSTILRTINVSGGNEELAILDYPFSQIDVLRNRENIMTLSGKNVGYGSKGFILDDISLTCKFRDTQHPNQSITKIDAAGLDVLSPVWQGKISYYESIEEENNTDIPTATAIITENKAHTGKKSLWVKDNFTQRQSLLRPENGKEYVISAWVNASKKTSDGNAIIPVATYATDNDGIGIRISGTKPDGTQFSEFAKPAGTIIEGWQRIEFQFTYQDVEELNFTFQKGAQNTYFDDIRFFAANGNMQSYVYNPVNYRLEATLDNNNYATLYSYDEEGNLYLIRKETIEGVVTIQESISHQEPKK